MFDSNILTDNTTESDREFLLKCNAEQNTDTNRLHKLPKQRSVTLDSFSVIESNKAPSLYKHNQFSENDNLDDHYFLVKNNIRVKFKKQQKIEYDLKFSDSCECSSKIRTIKHSISSMN